LHYRRLHGRNPGAPSHTMGWHRGRRTVHQTTVRHHAKKTFGSGAQSFLA
jgi:hypothetical protein